MKCLNKCSDCSINYGDYDDNDIDDKSAADLTCIKREKFEIFL
jgi:hypothetical protein